MSDLYMNVEPKTVQILETFLTEVNGDLLNQQELVTVVIKKTEAKETGAEGLTLYIEYEVLGNKNGHRLLTDLIKSIESGNVSNLSLSSSQIAILSKLCVGQSNSVCDEDLIKLAEKAMSEDTVCVSIDQLKERNKSMESLNAVSMEEPKGSDETKNASQMIEVTPEAFEAYQAKISAMGLCPIRFVRYVADRVKIETDKAILLQVDDLVCWVPKSCVYKFSTTSNGVSLYVREDFPLKWISDDF